MKTIKNDIDKLGTLMASAKEIEKEIDALKAKMKGRGVGVHEGKLFQANVYMVDGKETLDMDKVRGFLSSQQLVAARNIGKPSVCIRVEARKQSK